MKEFEFIEALSERFGGVGVKGIGDDAVLFGDKFLLAKDVLAENVHFLKSTPIDLVIKKLFTCNISDIASMGAVAKAALIGIASPNSEDLSPIFDAVSKYAEYYGVKIIGGDTSKSAGGLFLSMTAIGIRGKNILERRGAKSGDIIYLSRPVGLAKLSLEKELGKKFSDIDKYYHYSLEAETAVGNFLGEFSGITCACDISDGLGRDLSNMAKASGAKVIVNMDSIDLAYLKNYTSNAEEYFLSSGEEFALLFGVKPCALLDMEKEFEKVLGVKPLKIGYFSEGKSCVVLLNGEEKDISGAGFEHFEK